ncbi:helix-turn-helix domain-containing protein [Paenibacillus chartarius]|uniref:Helix-turn-helix domain-containing protein n=1 Tax=Paenibacillus chartarius TaxID=747481 RepID=A0ABV6DHL3_9BACL
MKEIKVFNRVPIFNEKQIEMQTEKQIRFLKAVHPQLTDTHWNEGRVELRPIKRDPNLKDYLRSFGSWHLGDKDVAELKKFLGAINGKGVDLYYSAFAFDYSMVVYDKDGNKKQKGKVNIENALFTSILAADFDGLPSEEFQREKQRLLDIGIETIDVFSGHGWQSIILLNHRVSDKEILKKFTTLMLAKGFKVDSAIVDAARVLRMPYSFNSKALDKKTKYYDPVNPLIIATTDHFWTERRYHVTEIFEKLNSLPDTIKQTNPLTEIDLKAISTAPISNSERKAEKEKVKREIEEVKQIKVETLKDVYSMLDFERLPLPIQKMLGGSQEGLRNKVMMFIIPFLRNTLGLSIQTIKEILALWGERCSPSLDADFVRSEVDRIYAKGFKGKFGKYTEELQKAYGYLEFNKYTKKNKIIIPNTFFEEYATLPDGAVRIYLAMKLAESLDGVKSFNKAEIQNYAQISESTFKRNMKPLVAMNFVSKRRACRRKGEDYAYYLNPYFSSVKGFTMLDNAVARLMLNVLTDGEIKLYSFLSKIVGEKECWTSQKYLAEETGKKGQSSISKMTDSLQRKGFITKRTTEKDGIKHSAYSLNY